MHSFTTERLLIRPLAEQDKALYISLYSDAKIMRNIGEPLSLEAAEKAFNSTLKAMSKEKPKVMTWAIVTLYDNKAVGIQALNWQKSTEHIDSKKQKTAEIGIMLSPTSHGKFIPKEATGAIMEYAFNYLPVTRIEAYYAKKNIIIARITKSFGFTLDTTAQPLDEYQSIQYIDKQSWNSRYIETITEDNFTCQEV